MKKIVSLTAIQAVLDAHFKEPVFVCLEPDDSRAAKEAAGKAQELWGFDPEGGWLGRQDGEFHRALVMRHPGGYFLLAIDEQPKTSTPADGAPRVVGQVVIARNQRGFIKVRNGKGLDGAIQELGPSSLSKGELSGQPACGTFYTNPQRLTGQVAVVIVAEDFEDSAGMKPEDFSKSSNDGRSLAAVAKARALGLI